MLETLQPQTVEWRIEVVEGLMQALIPLYKLDTIGYLFERNNYALCHSSLMRDWIPVIQEKELSLLKKELDDSKFSIIFDGTTNVCEVYCFVIRWVSGFQIHQRLAGIDLLNKSLNHTECAALLNRKITRSLIKDPLSIVCAIRIMHFRNRRMHQASFNKAK
jgi:hypothetical protein